MKLSVGDKVRVVYQNTSVRNKIGTLRSKLGYSCTVDIDGVNYFFSKLSSIERVEPTRGLVFPVLPPTVIKGGKKI